MSADDRGIHSASCENDD